MTRSPDWRDSIQASHVVVLVAPPVGTHENTQLLSQEDAMEAKYLGVLLVFCLFAVYQVSAEDKQTSEKQEKVEVEPEKLDYAKGSVCGYCEYCKFCKLCDEDCPCETSKSKPNCNMCKYCKYCFLCKGFCNTICQPGGIIDKVSAAVVNSLPSFNKEEVDSDIHSVKDWIAKKKDEL